MLKATFLELPADGTLSFLRLIPSPSRQLKIEMFDHEAVKGLPEGATTSELAALVLAHTTLDHARLIQLAKLCLVAAGHPELAEQIRENDRLQTRIKTRAELAYAADLETRYGR